MKDAKLALVTAIIQELGDTYRNRKPTLNRAEKALYENSLVQALRAVMPPAKATPVIAEYEQELEEARLRAAVAREARQKKGEGPVLTGAGGGASSDVGV